jgi:putative toxin-antitoxin system antitoxin component (TIGR02293 family)
MIYRLVTQGFQLKDVQQMLSLSDLYSSRKVIGRITSKSIRTLQRLSSAKQSVQLNAQQSAVAYQFAKVLEDAIKVFGTQSIAEEWLGRPCRHLDGSVPLDIIDNPLGFRAIEDYLARIEYGIYQ